MNRRLLLSILLFFTLIPMLLHADDVTDGARYGLLLWYNSVVPALFPFMVLSGLLVSLNYIHVIMTPFYRVLHRLLPISKDGCYVLVTGFLCGYPMGAKTCADFVAEQRISIEEGRFLMAICNHPSPMFLFGYVYSFYSEQIASWKLLISVYGPVLILALFASRVYFGHTNMQTFHSSSVSFAPEEKPAQTMDETILSAAAILCKIGGYLVIFSIIILFLRKQSWIPAMLRLAAIGALEMTTAVRELAASLDVSSAFCASVSAVTFGGLSGIFQTKAVLSAQKKGAGLSIRPYIFWKLIHASLSAGIAVLLCKF